MHRIAIVLPTARGGVKTITRKLVYGLRKEGLNVKLLPLSRNTILATFEDIKRVSYLKDFDVIIWMGSIPRLSTIFAKENITTMLFMHGFLRHEVTNILISTSTSPKDKLLGVYELTFWNVNKVLRTVDYYICHSITTCEENENNDNFVLLPQFIFLEEIELYNKLKHRFSLMSARNRHEVTIVTYTSFAPSPRLLQSHYIVRLVNIVAKRVDKRLKLVVIDPKIEVERREMYGNLVVQFSKTLPRSEFLKVLSSADIYIESCIDEELRLTSIEAALFGTPIAKLTHSKFIDRQDYNDEVLWASSPQNL